MKRMKLLNLFQKILFFLSLLVVIQNIFVILQRICLIVALVRVENIGQALHSRKSVTRCFVEWLMGPRKFHLQVKDIAESDATGMLKLYPRCVREGRQAFNAHLTGASAIRYVGITLFVNLQGFLGPHQRAGRCGYPRFLLCGSKILIDKV